MSENGNPIGAFLIGLILGVFSGVIIALLLAPESGEELRVKIQSGVETNLEKANLELERVKQTIQEKTNQPQLEENAQAPEVEA